MEFSLHSRRDYVMYSYSKLHTRNPTRLRRSWPKFKFPDKSAAGSSIVRNNNGVRMYLMEGNRDAT